MKQSILRCGLPYGPLVQALAEKHVNRLLVVHDAALPHLPVSRWIDQLEADGVAVTYFSDFRPNPDWRSAVMGLAALRMSGCNGILAIGGGSCMDMAKCIRLWTGSAPGEDPMAVTPAPLDIPLFVMPTTAGTGSEATRFAVVYRGGEKQSVEHERCLPDVVVLDPANLISLTPYQRISTMLDALCHGIESCWSVNSTEESRALSKKAVSGVMQALVPYLANEPEGNAAMQEAALSAGQAINLTKTTAGHAMCYKLTSLYRIAHGHAAALCVAALWPHLLANAERCCDPRGAGWLRAGLDTLAEAFGTEDAASACRRFAALLASLELQPLAMPGEETMTQLLRSVNLQRLKNHPVALTEEELRALYTSVFEEADHEG